MRTTKILVMGSMGMLGHQVVKYLKEFPELEVFATSRNQRITQESIDIDISDKENLERIIEKIEPNFIVNCIGVLIRGSKNINNAKYVNSYFPKLLRDLSMIYDFKLVHISTDCVFSGEKGNYHENDIRDGQGTYAETKKSGEVIDDRNVTLRTSIVGPELKTNGEGLFNWFLLQDKKIFGYKNSIWSGVTTYELSKAIKWSIDSEITGLYHLTNNSSINKFDLLHLFKKYTKKKIEIIPFENDRVDKSLIDTRKLINYEIPSYNRMIEFMIELIKEDKLTYPHYQGSIFSK